MPHFQDVKQGDPIGKLLGAKRYNAVNQLLNNTSFVEEDATLQTERSFAYLTCKNTTGDLGSGSGGIGNVDIPRGGVVGLDSPIFDADDNERGFVGNAIRWAVVAPDFQVHCDRFGIAVKPIPYGKVVEKSIVVVGNVPAKVDIISESHRYAHIIDGDVEKLVSDDQGVPMVPAQAGLGVKWAVMLLCGAAATDCFGSSSGSSDSSSSDSSSSSGPCDMQFADLPVADDDEMPAAVLGVDDDGCLRLYPVGPCNPNGV